MSLTHDVAHVSDITQFDTWARFERVSEVAETREDGPMLLVSTGVNSAFFNAAFVRGPVDDPAAFVAEAHAFFSERALPWRICSRVGVADAIGHAALDAGLRSTATMEGMTLSTLPSPSSEPGISIEIVEDIATLDMYEDVIARGFGMPIEMVRQMFPPASLKDPDLVLLLALCDGQPAATSLLSITGDIAGVYNVATLPEFRRRGLGAAVTRATLAEGAARGCTIGALQPSEMGRPVYAKLGFVSSALYLQFATPTPAPATAS